MAVAFQPLMDGRDRSPVAPGEGPSGTAPSPELVRAQLRRMLASRAFAGAPSLSRFLAYVVDATLDGRGDSLKEYSIGVDVFDRGSSFDPKIDTIVRVQARRLRAKVEEYYENEGRDDAVLIELEKGRYVPEFRTRSRSSVGTWRRGLAEVHRLPTAPEAQSPTRQHRSRVVVYATAAVVLMTVGAGAWWLMRPASERPITDPSEYTQLTDFTDSVTAPSLSPDGRMVTFIRGNEWFLSRGQIYVKLLPDGEPRRITDTTNLKYGPVFTADGSRVAYTQVDPDGWNTWTAPVLGGEPSRFLPNATALVWLDRQRVMFSEYKNPIPHMGVVTTSESRAERREIYFPIHVRGMAHYSYPSPDRKWILVVEMNGTGAFDRCRLVPFDGTSAGRQVGPDGRCSAAAWSPDGKWMYFSAEVGRQSHLWREPIAGGPPQQITFGPTDEEGVAVAPDGQSLVSALGQRQSSIWVHDAGGERALTTEGLALDPRLSADGRRVYFLLRPSAGSDTTELRVIDLATREERRLLNFIVFDHDLRGPQYDVSVDEQEVVYTQNAEGGPEVWLARLDRREAPRLVSRRAAFPTFGSGHDVFFVALEERSSVLVRTKKDGSERQQIFHHGPVVNRGGVSPDGKWVVVYAAAKENGGTATLALPVDGGTPRTICDRLCWARWSPDGAFLYVNVYHPARTVVIPLVPGQLLPDGPLDPPDGKLALPGMQVIPHMMAAPSRDTATYVFEKADVQRNLYRIPLH